MWTCPGCEEEQRDQSETCWKCGTSIDGEAGPGVAPERILEHILRAQRNQGEALNGIQRKAGYLAASIVLGIALVIWGLVR